MWYFNFFKNQVTIRTRNEELSARNTELSASRPDAISFYMKMSFSFEFRFEWGVCVLEYLIYMFCESNYDKFRFYVKRYCIQSCNNKWLYITRNWTFSNKSLTKALECPLWFCVWVAGLYDNYNYFKILSI